jgi:NAD(P)-dependent dehydrogenase (short-subunit alcohol dehydrogenase family)
MDFNEKVVLVTGSSMGIGKALARELLGRGAKVMLNGRNPEKLARTASELASLGEVGQVQGDVSDYGQAEAMVAATLDQFGRLDYLINNAGVATRGSVASMTPEVMQQVIQVNVLGSIFPTKAALAALQASRGGVLFISSIASFHGLPFNSVYCASKQALRPFSESLRLEMRESGVFVGLAYVGFTENDPDKVIMDADGRRIYLENRPGIRKQSSETVARILCDQLIRRRPLRTLSLAGKALALAQRLFPGLIDRVFRRQIARIQAQSTGQPRYVE